MANQETNEATIKNLESQVWKLAKQIAEQQTGPSFSANTQANPNDHYKVIVTRSGREVGGEENAKKGDEVVEEEIMVEEEVEDEKLVEKMLRRN